MIRYLSSSSHIKGRETKDGRKRRVSAPGRAPGPHSLSLSLLDGRKTRVVSLIVAIIAHRGMRNNRRTQKTRQRTRSRAGPASWSTFIAHRRTRNTREHVDGRERRVSVHRRTRKTRQHASARPVARRARLVVDFDQLGFRELPGPEGGRGGTRIGRYLLFVLRFGVLGFGVGGVGCGV